MTWWDALILGIVEGVTEYLPVSSTGHLILTAWLLGLSGDAHRWAATFSFNIVIQAGAILAVLGLYRQRVGQMIRGLLGRDLLGLKLAINLLVAFLPAAVLGLLLDKKIEEHLNGPWPVVIALFAGAILMLWVAYNPTGKRSPDAGKEIDSLSWRAAAFIGLAQCVAMWPGTSRSMMCIVAALLLGLRPRAAAEFTFLLGLITLTAATGYKGLKDGRDMYEQIGPLPIVIGVVAATISAALAVKWFVSFLNRHGLAPFGWYRLILAGLFAALLIMGVLHLPAVK